MFQREARQKTSLLCQLWRSKCNLQVQSFQWFQLNCRHYHLESSSVMIPTISLIAWWYNEMFKSFSLPVTLSLKSCVPYWSTLQLGFEGKDQDSMPSNYQYTWCSHQTSASWHLSKHRFHFKQMHPSKHQWPLNVSNDKVIDTILWSGLTSIYQKTPIIWEDDIFNRWHIVKVSAQVLGEFS